MSRDVAECLLSIDFDADDTERMNALAERAHEQHRHQTRQKNIHTL